jgi:hypothetical protein
MLIKIANAEERERHLLIVPDLFRTVTDANAG